jgi:hypothetical protein
MSENPAISIQQPWAELILLGRKKIELRTWRTDYRGLLWLHVGRKADANLIEQFGTNGFRGGYVGTVHLVSIVALDRPRWDAWQSQHLSGPYVPGYFGWVLADPQRFDEPIPAKGQLNLFEPDEETKAKLIRAQGC